MQAFHQARMSHTIWYVKYAYIYIYVYIHLYLHMYIYICVHIYIYTYVSISIYLSIYPSIHLSIYLCTLWYIWIDPNWSLPQGQKCKVDHVEGGHLPSWKCWWTCSHQCSPKVPSPGMPCHRVRLCRPCACLVHFLHYRFIQKCQWME